jgi:hypothetical protein
MDCRDEHGYSLLLCTGRACGVPVCSPASRSTITGIRRIRAAAHRLPYTAEL